MSLAPQFTQTRLAPTPSGYLHLGNILSFCITAAIAKNHDAKILLRIDDLDKVRANPLYVQDIFDTLNFLGIDCDNGPRDVQDFERNWSQLKRMNLYNAAMDKLKIEGHLFACTCSRTEYSSETCTCLSRQMSFETPSANLRIKTDKCQFGVRQLDENTVQAELSPSMQNFIVRKKDGYPSYQLASVVDDLHYGIDLIVRGQDLWDSTLAQLYLARLLGESRFEDIAFYHHPLIKDKAGEKLSKSAGATSIKYLREKDFTPAQVFEEILSLIGISGEPKTWGEFTEIIGQKYLSTTA